MEQTLALPHGLLSWDDIGPKQATTVVVLLHGFPHDRAFWAAQVEAHGAMFPAIRFLIPDLPGFGRSTPLADTTMDGYADAVASMLDAAGVRQAVIGGLSMGGYVAFSVWRRHADRTRALLLMDTRADDDSAAVRDRRLASIGIVERDGIGPLVAGMLPTQLGATTRATLPAVVERVENMLRRAPAAGVIGATRAMLARADSRATLPSITVPTLVLVGDEDTLTPYSDAVVIASAIEGSRLVTIPDAGHLAPLEQPATVNAAIAEFLDLLADR